MAVHDSRFTFNGLLMQRRAIIWVAGALAVYLAARLLPPAAGLNASGQAVLGTVLCGMLLWMSEALPLGVIAVFVLALLGAAPGVRPTLVFGGFTSPVLFFLIGVLSIGIAVEHAGLANRVGRFLLRRSKGSPTRLYFQMLAGLIGMAFMVPSAITRNSILIPAYQKTLETMGIAGSHRTGRAIMLTLGVLHTMASSALLTGGMVSMTAATLLGDFSWLGWFGLMALPYYALLFFGGTLLWAIVGRFEAGALQAHASAKPAVFSASEWRVVLTLGVTSLLWFTDALHGLSPAIPALFAATMLLFPGLGVMSWKDFEQRLSWELMLTVGVSLSLAQALTDTGGAAWLGALIVRALRNAGNHPRIVVTALIILIAVIHLAITNLAACIALLVPIATNVGREAGLNPIVCGLIVPIVVDAVILYPAQTATVLLAYESGYFNAADLRWFGLTMLALTIAVILLFVLPFWSFMGLQLTSLV